MPDNLLGIDYDQLRAGVVRQQAYAERMMRAQALQNNLVDQRMFNLYAQAILGQHGLQRNADTIPTEPTAATITPANDEERIFWRIPAAVYLVEKIPAARLVVKPSGITAAYLLDAKASGLSLRKQCEDLNVSWTARLLKAEEATATSVRAATILTPSVFAQTKPEADVQRWAYRIASYRDRAGARFSAQVANWVARHALDITGDDIDYLATLRALAISTKPATIQERSRQWHEDAHLRADQAEIERMEAIYGFRKRDAVEEWLRRVEYQGFEFVAIETAKDFIEEGREMRHCVAGRYGLLGSGYRYYSIRKEGQRLATVEYTADWRMAEIKARFNKQPGREVERAAKSFPDRVKLGPPEDAPAAEAARPSDLDMVRKAAPHQAAECVIAHHPQLTFSQNKGRIYATTDLGRWDTSRPRLARFSGAVRSVV